MGTCESSLFLKWSSVVGRLPNGQLVGECVVPLASVGCTNKGAWYCGLGDGVGFQVLLPFSVAVSMQFLTIHV